MILFTYYKDVFNRKRSIFSELLLDHISSNCVRGKLPGPSASLSLPVTLFGKDGSTGAGDHMDTSFLPGHREPCRGPPSLHCIEG